MRIRIIGLSEEKFAELNEAKFINSTESNVHSKYLLYDVTLKEEVILKSSVTVMLDKGGYYISLDSSDFSHIAIS